MFADDISVLKSAAFAALLFAVGADTVFAEAPSPSALCAGHKTCRVVKTTPAGVDAQGRHLGVAELDIGKEDDGGFRCRPYRREFWLSIPGVKPQRLFELCNDGYGASNVGEDRITVGPNRFTHFQKGGSAWRWSVERILSLVPFRIASQQHCSYHNLASGYTRTRWDWRNFKAEVAWRPPPCSDDDNPGDRVGCDARPATHAHTAIPRLDAAAAAMAKPLHLGSCAYAMRIPESPGQPRAGRPAAEVRMLMISTHDLIVTVADDEIVTGSADWRDDDHLELWLGPNVVGLACLADAKEPIRQWGISLADGKINTGSGDPQEAPTLARFTARTIGNRREVTVHLVLGDGKFTPGITLGYSKKDGAKPRVVATSAIKPGDATTVGSVWVVDSRGATCAEKDGRLDLTDTGLPAALEQ